MSTDLPALVWDDGRLKFHRKLGNFVQYFQVNLPTNGHGIPFKLIDPIMIVEHLLDCETTDDMPDEVVERALLNVEFEDGLPIIEGTPIWERLDGELVDYYKLFKEYREMLYFDGARAISKLATKFSISGAHLSALSKVYHWQIRCRAYDTYYAMRRERMRQMEIEKLESKHAKAAERMLDQALSYLEEHPEQLNPKVAVQMIQVAMRAGRLALGLNPDKPGTSDATPSTNININQTAANGEKMSTTIEVNEQSPQHVEQDLSQLQSILHILDKSGALDKVRVVDADFTVMEEDGEEASA